MKDLKSKVAYLQGLSAGMDISSETKEGRVLNGIIELLDEFAHSFDRLEEAHGELEDYLESLDEDLFSLEEGIYREADEESELNADDYMEVECPRCGEAVCFDPDVLEDEDTVEITCPNCDEVVFVNDDFIETADEPEQLNLRPAAEEDDI